MRPPAPPARSLLGPAAVALACLAATPASAEPPPPPPPPPPADPALAPPPIMAELGVRYGGAIRIGSAPSFEVGDRGGSMVGVGLAITPTRLFRIGLAYEHASLGSEHGAGDLGSVNLTRSLDSLWATLRLSLYRGDWLGLGVTLGPGLVWQSVGAAWTVPGETPASAYRCTETAGPGLGLRAGLGAEIRLGHGLFVSLDGVIDEMQLSSDPLGTCAPGAGSTAVFGVRAGFAYRLDVSRYVR
jgi:hypothetical protein